jgi:exosortase N
MMGGIHFIGLIHAFLASPFFTYVSSLVSFPIRLQLSKAVSYLLNHSGIENNPDGNIIHLKDHSFLVDQACSGMYLLGYGMLFGTLILSIRIRTKSVSWKWLLLHYSLLLSLIIWGNLVRIYFLVVFNIESGHWMHDGVGLIIYLIQILLPFYLILRIGRKRIEKASYEHSSAPRFPIHKYTLLIVLLISLFVRVGIKRTEEALQDPVISLAGFDSEVLKSNVTKLHNDHTLIYLKSPVAAYGAEHNPIICWSGSGYEFQKVEKIMVSNHEVNAAELKKDADVLYTAWWFESTVSKTGDQWDWRWKAIYYGEDFYLINVTCSTKENLNDQLKILLEKNTLIQMHENKNYK